MKHGGLGRNDVPLSVAKGQRGDAVKDYGEGPAACVRGLRNFMTDITYRLRNASILSRPAQHHDGGLKK
jgi:hypothetical protein